MTKVLKSVLDALDEPRFPYFDMPRCFHDRRYWFSGIKAQIDHATVILAEPSTLPEDAVLYQGLCPASRGEHCGMRYGGLQGSNCRV